MVDMFFWGKFATEKSFHNDAVFWFVVAITNMNVAITVFNINANKNFSANRFAVAAHEGIMILTKTLCPRWISTIVNAARCFLTICLFGYRWIAVSVPSIIVLPTIAMSDTRSVTFID